MDQSSISDPVQEQILQLGIHLLELLYSPVSNEQEIDVIYNQFSEEEVSNLKSDQLADEAAVDLILLFINAADGPRIEFKK